MNTVTRKDIAQAAGVSQDTVKRREREWGIYACRSHASNRPVLYFRDQVNTRLVTARIIPRPI